MLKVNGENLQYTPNMTVKDVLKKMGYSFPLLIVKVNGKRIKREDFSTTKIEDNSTIQVIHLMSGG